MPTEYSISFGPKQQDVARNPAEDAQKPLNFNPKRRDSAVSTITLLRAVGWDGSDVRPVLTKSFSPAGEQSYGQAKFFEFDQRDVATFDDLTGLLAALNSEPDVAVVPGKIKDSAADQDIIRRLLNDGENDDGTVAPATIEDGRSYILHFDLDGQVMPTGHSWDDPEAAARAVVAGLMQRLPALGGVSYFWQASSSAGIDKDSGKTDADGRLINNSELARFHVWAMIDHSVDAVERKAIYAAVGADASVAGAAHISYTAAPIFEGGRVDPLAHRQRFGVVRGARDFLRKADLTDVLEIADQKREAREARAAQYVGELNVGENTTAWGQQQLEMVLSRIVPVKGGRNNAIYGAAMDVQRLINGGEVGQADGLAALEGRAQWSREPGWRATVKSGLRAARNEVVRNPNAALDGLFGGVAAQPIESSVFHFSFSDPVVIRSWPAETGANMVANGALTQAEVDAAMAFEPAPAVEEEPAVSVAAPVVDYAPAAGVAPCPAPVDAPAPVSVFDLEFTASPAGRAALAYLFDAHALGQMSGARVLQMANQLASCKHISFEFFGEEYERAKREDGFVAGGLLDFEDPTPPGPIYLPSFTDADSDEDVEEYIAGLFPWQEPGVDLKILGPVQSIDALINDPDVDLLAEIDPDDIARAVKEIKDENERRIAERDVEVARNKDITAQWDRFSRVGGEVQRELKRRYREDVPSVDKFTDEERALMTDEEVEEHEVLIKEQRREVSRARLRIRSELREEFGLSYLPTLKDRILHPEGARQAIIGGLGIGKSASAVGRNGEPGFLHRGKGMVTFAYAPTTAKSQESFDDYMDNGGRLDGAPKAILVRGRNQTRPDRANGEKMCLIPGEVEEAIKLGLSVNADICQTCPFKSDCGYQAQVQEIKEACAHPDGAVLFATSAYLWYRIPGAPLVPDRVVVDEDVTGSAVAEVALTKEELSTPVEMPPQPSLSNQAFEEQVKRADAIKPDLHRLQKDIVDGFISPNGLIGHLINTGWTQESISHVCAGLAYFKDQSGAQKALHTARDYHAAARANHGKPNFGNMLKRALGSLQKNAVDKLQGLFTAIEIEMAPAALEKAWARMEDGDQLFLPAKSIRIDPYSGKYTAAWVQRPSFGHELPILALDGTGDADLMKWALGEMKVDVIDPPRNAHVTQVTGNTFSDSQMTAPDQYGEALREGARKVISEKVEAGKKVLVVTNKKVGKALGIGTLGVEIMDVEDNCGVLDSAEFGSGRGLNSWEDFDIVFIVGRIQPPVEAIENDALPWLALAGEDANFVPVTKAHDGRDIKLLPVETKTLKMKNGETYQIDVVQHPSRIAEKIRWQRSAAPIIQLAERLRLVFAATQKEVVLMASLPTLQPDVVVSKDDFFAGGSVLERVTQHLGFLPISGTEIKNLCGDQIEIERSQLNAALKPMLERLSHFSNSAGISYRILTEKPAQYAKVTQTLAVVYRHYPSENNRKPEKITALVPAESLEEARGIIEAVTGPLAMCEEPVAVGSAKKAKADTVDTILAVSDWIALDHRECHTIWGHSLGIAAGTMRRHLDSAAAVEERVIKAADGESVLRVTYRRLAQDGKQPRVKTALVIAATADEARALIEDTICDLGSFEVVEVIQTAQTVEAKLLPPKFANINRLTTKLARLAAAPAMRKLVSDRSPVRMRDHRPANVIRAQKAMHRVAERQWMAS